MAVFNNACLTIAGLALEAQAAAGTAKIGISSMVVGTGIYTDTSTEALEQRTALMNQNDDAVVTLNSVSQFDATQVNIKGTVSNEDLEAPITVTEVGIYAYDTLSNSTPILYAIAVATTGDILPEYNGEVPSYIIEQMLISVGNSSTVSVMVPIITDADNVAYDNSGSGMDADNIQDAVDELHDEVSNDCLRFEDVAIAATTGDIATVTDDLITADHVLANIVWGDCSAIGSDVTLTTSAGSMVLNGTCTTATTATIILAKKDN